MIFRPCHVLIIALLLWPGICNGQTRSIIYDGYTGINRISKQNDTLFVASIIPGSPADKAGVLFRDQIIAINDAAVSGRGMDLRQVREMLHNKKGEVLGLTIKRKGVDSPMHFSLIREPYLLQIDAYEYEYLIDSLEKYDIGQISSGSLDSLFINPLVAKSRVWSVEEGSAADKNGILPGDQIISLMEELDGGYEFHISSDAFSTMIKDTSFTILRGDSLIQYQMKPSVSGSLKGIESQFNKDFQQSCAWLKIRTVNRISENRDYLLNLPELSGTESVNFFLPRDSGTMTVKRSGILIPVADRDYIYKNWHAATIPLEKNKEQTIYIRWVADTDIGPPLMHFIAQETMVHHDRIERMVLFALLGMMLIIACFFLILFFALREREYVYFSLYILFIAVFLFVSEGYLGEYQWSATVYNSLLISGAQALSLSLVTIFFLLFGTVYLELKQKYSGWYWSVVVLLGIIGVRILIMLLGSVLNFQLGGFFKNMLVIIWALSVAIIPLFLLVLPALLRIREGFKPAWYFLLANLVLIPLAIITIDSSTFSLSAQKINEPVLVRILQVSGVYVAAILQILIFSIGLAQKMRLNEKERKNAQLRIIDQLKENEKLKDKVNRELEQKVRERTREISEQKEEIESQRDEIEAQRDLLFSQKKEITDSIGYAQRIQAAILPHKSYLDSVVPEYFVLYKPRDIVSGDFYWIREVDTSLVVVVADCTGHGVPGAFMSMLGITLLNELFAEGWSGKPGEILGALRNKVKAMLVQEGGIRDQKDGMDMAMAIIDKEKKELQYGGAYNPLYLIRRDGELVELRGDKQPIGIHWEESDFKTRVVRLEDRDSIYVFSDGYVDQYGGAQRKKFKSQKFKDLLLSIQAEPMGKQKQIIDKTFEVWRGNLEQIDDVCVVGVRV